MASVKTLLNTLKPVLFLAVLPSLVIFGVIFVFQRPAHNVEPTTPYTDIRISNSSVKLNKTGNNFGTISQKEGLVDTVYEVTNTGSEDIFLKEMYTSCACTKAQLIYPDGSTSSLYTMKGHANPQDFYVGKSIKPGETVKIKAVFDPNAHGPQGIGYIKRNIMLDTNMRERSLIQVSLEADVTK